MRHRLGLALAMCLTTTLASDGEITFFHDGIGSGTIGGVTFNDASFTITARGDTLNRQSFGPGWWIDHDSVQVSIEGQGVFDVFTGTRTYVNNDVHAVGFARAGLTGWSHLYGPVDGVLASWDMLSGVGPVDGQGLIMQWNVAGLSTSGGSWTMDDSSGPSTFVAEFCSDPGSPFCFGDGSDVPCPCFGFGGPGEGCSNSSGPGGASMTGTGTPCSVQDTLVFQIDGVPGERPGLLLRGDNQVVDPIGDGVLCTAGNSQRSHIQITSAGSTTFNHFGFQPFGEVANLGAPTHFQFWYRDPDNNCSGQGFNFSNAWTVTYQP